MRSISDKTLADLGWPRLVNELAERTHTTRGRHAAQTLPWWPSLDAARERMAEITEARAMARVDRPMSFGGIQDVREALSRAAKGGVLGPEELVAVADSGRGLDGLRRHLEHHRGDCTRLAVRGAAIDDLGHVFHPILESFEPDGTLADHASDALGPLRRRSRDLKAELERRMRTLIEDARYAPHLQDKFYTQRDERYVIPVNVDSRGRVRGIVHGTSGSGHTVFVEPDEIVDLNNRLKLAECDVDDEERRIFAQLTAYVAEDVPALRRALDTAEILDVIAAAARLADDMLATEPTLEARAGITLESARHPLMALAERGCVPNDLIIGRGTTLVISGPNAGGKTVALKTAGLVALMVRLGLHVPAAPGSVVGWFDGIASDIGDSQSIEMDLSTYSAHLLELRRFLDEVDDVTLVLVDEISVGTDPEQGAALAQAVLEELARRGGTTIVTTHYERLKALAAAPGPFRNASVGFDLQRMEPTFRLHLDAPGSSGALHVARRMGLPDEVTARAEELLGERRASIEELLANVSDQRRRLEEERAALLLELEDAERARQAAESARDAARERERKLAAGAHSEAVVALRRARRELDEMRAALKKRQHAGDLASDKRRMDQVSAELARLAPDRELPPGRRPRPDELVPGTPVIVSSLGGRGVVLASPQRGRVTVQVGALKSIVAVEGVLIDTHRIALHQAEARDERRRRRAARAQSEVAVVKAEDHGKATARTPDRTCDVRGERVDDAIDRVDRFVDESLIAERDAVFVIHGHGTGALKNAVREHARGHAAISKWRAGEASEGGDGVTVLFLELD